MKTGRIRQGSYTVEASFIIPFILFVIFTICYLAFYLYEQVVMETEMHLALIESEMHVKFQPFLKTDYKEKERIVLDEMEENLRRRVFNFDIKRHEIEMKGGLVMTKIIGKRKVSIPVVEGMLGKDRLMFEARKTIHDPCDAVRKWEALR